MALTSEVKAELAAVPVSKPAVRKAEVVSLLRFAGGLHVASGRIIVEADLDSGGAARRLKTALFDLYGFSAEFVVVTPSQLRRGTHYVVRLIRDGEALARQTGLVDLRGRPVRGLPATLVTGGSDVAAALWRGAFLAHGSLTEPGRSMAMEVSCPNSESALALVGAARRLGVSAKAREVRNVDRVVIRDGDAIARMLTILGAHQTLLAWEERRMRREIKGQVTRLANFDDANLRRSVYAALAACARVERAFELLRDEVPDHLRTAGELRLAHRQASLEELGQYHEPPLTKDAVAGRIRRLLGLADKRAAELGVPGTEAAAVPELEDVLTDDPNNSYSG